MSRRVLALGGVALLAAACSAQPVPSRPTASPTPLPSPGPPSQSPKPSPALALAACAVSQLDVTTGHWGGAAGTNYLTVFVELAQGPSCALPESPKVTIVGPDGAVLASSAEFDSTPFPLATTTTSRFR